MKIIVLGMDNTGKTTLCNMLSERLHLKHLTSKGKDADKRTMVMSIINLHKMDDYIQERCCFFEEMVYGKIIRNESKFTFSDKRLLEMLRGCNIIYCRPHIKTIQDWKDREQMDGVIDYSKQLVKRWDKIIKKLKKHSFNIIRYNYKRDSLEHVITKLQ